MFVPLEPIWYVTDVELTVTEVPFAPSLPSCPLTPALATANENFLFTVIPSTTTGIVASHADEMIAVVVNVIFTLFVPLPSTAALIPVGSIIELLSTLTEAH